MDRLGPRIFTTIAGVLVGFGWSALAFASERWQLYTFYSIAGIGAAFVYSGSIASALKWFPDRRGLAAGIIAGGFGSEQLYSFLSSPTLSRPAAIVRPF